LEKPQSLDLLLVTESGTLCEPLSGAHKKLGSCLLAAEDVKATLKTRCLGWLSRKGKLLPIEVDLILKLYFLRRRISFLSDRPKTRLQIASI
jgi:hypothetical protein